VGNAFFPANVKAQKVGNQVEEVEEF